MAKRGPAGLERLPHGVRLASPGLRLAAVALELVLAVVTLGVGWFVWMLIVFARGQTPGKQLLRMRVVGVATGRPVGWGRMFVRELVVEPIVIFVSVATVIGVVSLLWLVWDDRNQELWDKVVDTVVVHDPDKRL